jgi:hypothetical protein
MSCEILAAVTLTVRSTIFRDMLLYILVDITLFLEVHTASTYFLPTTCLLFGLNTSSLQMKTVFGTEMPVSFYETTQRHIPEDVLFKFESGSVI